MKPYNAPRVRSDNNAHKTITILTVIIALCVGGYAFADAQTNASDIDATAPAEAYAELKISVPDSATEVAETGEDYETQTADNAKEVWPGDEGDPVLNEGISKKRLIALMIDMGYAGCGNTAEFTEGGSCLDEVGDPDRYFIEYAISFVNMLRNDDVRFLVYFFDSEIKEELSSKTPASANEAIGMLEERHDVIKKFREKANQSADDAGNNLLKETPEYAAYRKLAGQTSAPGNSIDEFNRRLPDILTSYGYDETEVNVIMFSGGTSDFPLDGSVPPNSADMRKADTLKMIESVTARSYGFWFLRGIPSFREGVDQTSIPDIFTEENKENGRIIIAVATSLQGVQINFDNIYETIIGVAPSQHDNAEIGEATFEPIVTPTGIVQLPGAMPTTEALPEAALATDSLPEAGLATDQLPQATAAHGSASQEPMQAEQQRVVEDRSLKIGSRSNSSCVIPLEIGGALYEVDYENSDSVGSISFAENTNTHELLVLALDVGRGKIALRTEDDAPLRVIYVNVAKTFDIPTIAYIIGACICLIFMYIFIGMIRRKNQNHGDNNNYMTAEKR